MKKSAFSHAVLDPESRKKKAHTILEILKGYKKLENCAVLDIGTGSGIIAAEIAKHCKKVFSVDVADERIGKKGYVFRKVKDEKLPFPKDSFDIVISNHVMAHTKDDEVHLGEISRVLKKDGISYLTMLNRFCLIEPNFSLPFLSWLPGKMADRYVRGMGKGQRYDVHPLTRDRFIQKVKRHFEYRDVTPLIIRKRLHFPLCGYSLFRYFTPVWILILKKKSTI